MDAVDLMSKFYWRVGLALIVTFVISILSLKAQTIEAAEYFINVDPGVGAAIPVTVPVTGAAVAFDFNAPISSLPSGFHVMGFRVREGGSGQWSLAGVSTFYIAPSFSFPDATSIVRGEYFFDADPGQGSGTSFNASPASPISLALNGVATGGLSGGFHTLSFRFRDNQGRWGHPYAQTFYVVPPSTASNATNIIAAEYFIDSDLGSGNNVSLPIVASSSVVANPMIAINALTKGFHNIGVRYKDEQGNWGHPSISTFYVLDNELLSKDIVQAEYFVDTDPGIGLATRVEGIVPAASVDQLVMIDMTGVPTGAHVLNIRLKDSSGFWSYTESSTFTISACVPPSPPSVDNVDRCGAGPVTLAAEGALNTQEYRWYVDPLTDEILHTGIELAIDHLEGQRTYYVSVYDPSTSCESSRSSVTANALVIPPPIVNPSGQLSFCEGSSVFLSAAGGHSHYEWSSGQLTQSILVNEAGSYTVRAGNGTCWSDPSVAVEVLIATGPDKPVISVQGETTICGTGTVVLSGPEDFDYLWSNGETTRSITVGESGLYYLVVRTESGGCPSAISNPVVVTVLTPPCGASPTNQSPVISQTPLATTIEGILTIDITSWVSDPDNDIDFATLQLVSSSTSQGAPAFIDDSYNLVVDYSGIPFTGVDRVTVQVCDLAGACVQQILDIEVAGGVVVYNGVTPDGDGKNDFLLLKYVEVVEGAASNNVTIFNRWGHIVFETRNYNNSDRAFIGRSRNGELLPSGTYFYRIEFDGDLPTQTGFLTLLR